MHADAYLQSADHPWRIFCGSCTSVSSDTLPCFLVSQRQLFSHTHEVRSQMQETQAPDMQNKTPITSPPGCFPGHKISIPLPVFDDFPPPPMSLIQTTVCKLCSLGFHNILPAAQEGKSNKRDPTSLYRAKRQHTISK